MNDCLSLPGLGWKNFNSLRKEDDEPIHTYNEKYMQCFVWQSIKGGRVCAYDQFFHSKSCDYILKCLSKEFVSSTTYNTTEKFLKYRDQHEKIL